MTAIGPCTDRNILWENGSIPSHDSESSYLTLCLTSTRSAEQSQVAEVAEQALFSSSSKIKLLQTRHFNKFAILLRSSFSRNTLVYNQKRLSGKISTSTFLFVSHTPMLRS